MSGEGGWGPRATIDLDAIRANARLAQRRAGARDVIAVVKADAYGHGAVPVSRALLEAGCTRLAVLSVEEAAELREAAIAAPILVLGGVSTPREAADAAAIHATPVVHGEGSLRLVVEAAQRAGRQLPVHVEVDTGMRRMGVALDEAEALLARAAAQPELQLEGVFTHFARADSPDPGASLEQIRLFRGLLERLRETSGLPSVVHADNSAALLADRALAEALPEANAVRPGLMLYGARAAPHLDAPLVPAMSVLARVIQVHSVRAGESVGYAGTWRPKRPTRVATLRIGYADGVAWTSANRARVWLGGQALPVVGRISMDYVGVEIGETPVGIGDEALLFGRAADGGIPVEEAADEAGTLAYELLVRVGRRVRREWIG